MNNVKAMLVVVVTLAGGAVQAQQVVTPAIEPALPAAQPPQSAPAAASPGGSAAVDPRRDDIRVMETMLTQALQKGAQDLARQLKVSEPNSAFIAGTGRARGFVLDGYGMFFDVDVPGMKYSVVWSAQMVRLVQERENARQFLATARPDDPLRRVAEQQLRQVERLMVAAQGGAVLIPNAAANTQMAPPESVSAAIAVADNGVAPAAATPPALMSSLATNAEPRDPNELYTESVKNALIDAMLRNTAFLKIADNEWLTVAASDSEGPQVPGQIDDASRIVIRVKGSDLAAFHARKLTREEMLKRVEVREF